MENDTYLKITCSGSRIVNYFLEDVVIFQCGKTLTITNLKTRISEVFTINSDNNLIVKQPDLLQFLNKENLINMRLIPLLLN